MTMKSNIILPKSFQATPGNYYNSDGLLILTVAETKTETDDKYTEPNENLCCYLSLCNVYTTFAQSCTTHFLSVSVSATVSVRKP